MYSSQTRVHIFKDSDSDSSPFVRTRTWTWTRMQRTRTRTRTLRTRTRAIRTQTQTQTVHWDSMFKKIQWTFIYFLSSNYLVPLQYQYMAGYCGYSQWLCQGYTVHMSQNWHWTHWPYLQLTAPCKLNMCSAVGKRSSGHTGHWQDSWTSWSYDLNTMWTCCNILACNDDQISTYGLYSWSIHLVEIL